MTRILIVDDDPAKSENVKKVVTQVAGVDTKDVTFAANLVEARDVLSKQYFDLLILDILLPAIMGEEPSTDTGRQFIKELRLSNTLLRPAHIIGLTAYDHIRKEVDPAFHDEVWRVIHYDPSTDGWVTQLKAKVSYIARCKAELLSGENKGYEYDLGIVTALRDPELKAILDLPADWRKEVPANDGTGYFVGSSKDAMKKMNVVAGSCSQMGIASAAVLAMKMISHFRPRYLCIAGISAGIEAAGVSFGDVLIAEQSWDYGSGKRRATKDGKGVLAPDPHHIPIKGELRDKFSECVGKRAYLKEIANGWKARMPEGELRAFLGPVASGSAVVEDPVLIEEVRSHARKLIGVEMETYGVFFAAENCCKPRPIVFSVKSVVDFADPMKSDAYQDYAAYTSAQYIWNFAVEHIAVPI